MARNPTTGKFDKAKAILEAAVMAAVEADMAARTTRAFPFGDACLITLPRREARTSGPPSRSRTRMSQSR